jgi:hypothetical protein
MWARLATQLRRDQRSSQTMWIFMLSTVQKTGVMARRSRRMRIVFS